jgi:hypothetical protein
MSVWLSSSVTVNTHRAQYMECFVNMKLDLQAQRCFRPLYHKMPLLRTLIYIWYRDLILDPWKWDPEDGSSLFGTGSLMRPKCFAQEGCSTSICVWWKLLVHTWHSTWADNSFEPCIVRIFHFNQPLLVLGHFLQVDGHWVDESQTYSCSTVENKGYYHLLNTQSNFWEFLSQVMHGQYVSFCKGSVGK